MIYKNYNKIQILSSFGVSRVADDTLILAKQAAAIKGKRVLDMGTGTGFIAIYLASIGRIVDAVDISEISIETAAENAKKNNVDITFYLSDLFDNIKEVYDIIVFNPPIGSPFEGRSTVFIEKIKYLFPRSTILYKFLMLFLGGQRKKLIQRFLTGAMLHLRKNGTIIMFITDAEKSILKKYNHKIIIDHGKNIALIAFV